MESHEFARLWSNRRMYWARAEKSGQWSSLKHVSHLVRESIHGKAFQPFQPVPHLKAAATSYRVSTGYTKMQVFWYNCEVAFLGCFFNENNVSASTWRVKLA